MDVQVLFKEGEDKQIHNKQMTLQKESMPQEFRDASVLRGGSGLVVTTNEVATAIVSIASKQPVMKLAIDAPYVKVVKDVDLSQPKAVKKSVKIQRAGYDITKAPAGTTTYNANHTHKYNVDANGNGWTEYAVSPENPKVRHRHRIINYKVQVAKSSCYPNCKQLFDASGVPPHNHNIYSKSLSKKKGGPY